MKNPRGTNAILPPSSTRNLHSSIRWERLDIGNPSLLFLDGSYHGDHHHHHQPAATATTLGTVSSQLQQQQHNNNNYNRTNVFLLLLSLVLSFVCRQFQNLFQSSRKKRQRLSYLRLKSSSSNIIYNDAIDSSSSSSGLFFRGGGGGGDFGDDNNNHQQQKGEKSTTTTSQQQRPPLLFCDVVDDDDEVGGVWQEDVNRLVEACLKDPDINIGSVPDWLERQIYRSTITLILNALHRGLNGIHGRKFLLSTHQFQVYRLPRRQSNMDAALTKMSLNHHVDEEGPNRLVLQKIADRLLQNKNINQPLIPDVLERQIYASCLRIVMRVIDLIAVSFRITLCGHELQMKLKPQQQDIIIGSSGNSNVVSRKDLHQAALERIASKSNRRSGGGGLLSSDEITLEHMKEVAKIMAEETDKQLNFWQRWRSPAHNEFIAQLHASVYCLVLGILDDLLEHTELQILSDRIEFDLIPVSSSSTNNKEEEVVEGEEENSTVSANHINKGTSSKNIIINNNNKQKSRKLQNCFILLVGVSVGYGLHAVVDQHFPLLHLSNGIAQLNLGFKAVLSAGITQVKRGMQAIMNPHYLRRIQLPRLQLFHLPFIFQRRRRKQPCKGGE